MVKWEIEFNKKINWIRSIIESKSDLIAQEEESLQENVNTVRFYDGSTLVCSLQPQVWVRNEDNEVGTIEFSGLPNSLRELKCFKDESGNFYWQARQSGNSVILDEEYILEGLKLACNYVGI